MHFGQRFGRLVRRLRGTEDLTQEKLAVIAFGDERHAKRISELENGKISRPRSKTVDALVVALNISESDLNKCYTDSVASNNFSEIENTEAEYWAELRRPRFSTGIRKLVGDKLLQVAVDTGDIELAKSLARTSEKCLAHVLEIGDPLIKRYGFGIVSSLRVLAPKIPIVLEFASSDWIDEQIRDAANLPIDAVQILGIRNENRIKRAIHSARSAGIGIIIGNTLEDANTDIFRIAIENEADGIALIRNIDSYQNFQSILSALKRWFPDDPIARFIAGGFTPAQIRHIIQENWTVAIVGSAIVNSPDPAKVILEIMRVLDDEQINHTQSST